MTHVKRQRRQLPKPENKKMTDKTENLFEILQEQLKKRTG